MNLHKWSWGILMGTDKPRYSRVSDIIELAVFIASKPLGVTINDIATKYNVSRRTAERMRDSLLNIFSQIEEIPTQDNQKHWGFVDYSIKELVYFTPKEVASLSILHDRTTNKELKSDLEATINKIKTLQVKNKATLENNIEMILQSEGYALRQMPQYKIDNDVLMIIREAIKDCKCVQCVYNNKTRLIEPLGMIYGEKIYLFLRERLKDNNIYTFALHKIKNLVLTDKIFDKEDFDLKEYSKRSFGVYFGEILEVKLQFNKEIAEDVLTYNFHPTQKMKQKEDGSVIVKFKASGDKEIMWHIFKWGDKVKILAPKSLQKEYKETLQKVFDKNFKK